MREAQKIKRWQRFGTNREKRRFRQSVLAQAPDDCRAIIRRLSSRQASPLSAFREAESLVGRGGVEPPTSRLSGVRSNHLSYRPLPAEWLKAISMTVDHPHVSRLRIKTRWWSPSRQRRANNPSIGSTKSGEAMFGGAYRDRTDDLLNAIQPLSQLS